MLSMLPPKHLLYAGTRDPTCLSRAVVSEVSPRLLVSSEVWRYFTGHFPGQAPATGVLRRFSGNKSIVLGGFEEIRLFTEENTSRHVSRTCLQYFFVTSCVR